MPIHAANYNPTLILVTLGAFAVIGVLLTIFGDGLAFRLSMGTLSVLMILGAAATLLFQESIQEGALRIPASLTLTEDGIRGVRGSKAITIGWDDLAGADVAPSRTGAKLVLKRHSGDAIVIEPRWTGSDPNLVAPIVNHFLRRPSDRGTLADPSAALRLVEEAAAY